MKTIISFLLCITFCYPCFAQSSPIKELNSEGYLHKSKVKKTIGCTFLGAGAVLFITGGIIDKVKQPELLAGFTYEFIGISSALVSIPFFISSSKNKRKALVFTLNTRKAVKFRQNVASQFEQPTVTFKIIL